MYSKSRIETTRKIYCEGDLTVTSVNYSDSYANYCYIVTDTSKQCQGKHNSIVIDVGKSAFDTIIKEMESLDLITYAEESNTISADTHCPITGSKLRYRRGYNSFILLATHKHWDHTYDFKEFYNTFYDENIAKKYNNGHPDTSLYNNYFNSIIGTKNTEYAGVNLPDYTNPLGENASLSPQEVDPTPRVINCGSGLVPFRIYAGAYECYKFYNMKNPTSYITDTLVNGDVIVLSNICLRVVHVPGHTKGHNAFIITSRNKIVLVDPCTERSITTSSQFVDRCLNNNLSLDTPKLDLLLFAGDHLFASGIGTLFEGNTFTSACSSRYLVLTVALIAAVCDIRAGCSNYFCMLEYWPCEIIKTIDYCKTLYWTMLKSFTKQHPLLRPRVDIQYSTEGAKLFRALVSKYNFNCYLYPAHDFTLFNLGYTLRILKEAAKKPLIADKLHSHFISANLPKAVIEVEELYRNALELKRKSLPSVPTALKRELKYNLFFRCSIGEQLTADVAILLGLQNSNELNDTCGPSEVLHQAIFRKTGSPKGKI